MSDTLFSDAYVVKDRKVRQSAKIDPDFAPRVSLCVPTLNDEETIEWSLCSMQRQSYPNMELIVVDGYSDDDTVDIARTYADKIYFDDGNYGSACMKGVENATGDIVGLFDGDIYLPHADWLSDAVSYFSVSDDISTVWPKNVHPPGSPLLTRLYFNHWELIIENRIENGRGFYGGGNALFSLDALEEIGGIDESIHWGADFDWAQRLYQTGYKVVYHQDPIYHDTMNSFAEFINKQKKGAKTFTDTGFTIMGMDKSSVFYEQFILGTYGMLRGMFLNQQPSWLLYPLYLFVRTAVYCSVYSRKFLDENIPYTQTS